MYYILFLKIFFYVLFTAPHIEENRNIVGGIQGLEEHDQTAIMYSNQDPVLASSSSGMMKNTSSRNVSPHEVIFQMDPRNGIAKYDYYSFHCRNN